MKPQTVTGTWEEIRAREAELVGHRLQVTILPDEITDSLEDYIAEMKNRTPEEIAEVRERILKSSPTPREIPPGKTLVDMIGGKWPGDETDEEIAEALRRLS